MFQTSCRDAATVASPEPLSSPCHLRQRWLSGAAVPAYPATPQSLTVKVAGQVYPAFLRLQSVSNGIGETYGRGHAVALTYAFRPQWCKGDGVDICRISSSGISLTVGTG